MGDKLAEAFAKEVCTFKYLPPEDTVELTRIATTSDEPKTETAVETYPDYDITEEIRAVSPIENPALTLLQNMPCFEGTGGTYLQPIFSAETGEIITMEERWITEQEQECTAQNSMSINRTPDPKSFNILRGSTGNVPFLPAGFDDNAMKLSDLLNACPKALGAEDELKYLNFEELLMQPPGFDEPIDLGKLMEKQKAATGDKDKEKGEKVPIADDEKNVPKETETEQNDAENAPEKKIEEPEQKSEAGVEDDDQEELDDTDLFGSPHHIFNVLKTIEAMRLETDEGPSSIIQQTAKDNGELLPEEEIQKLLQEEEAKRAKTNLPVIPSNDPKIEYAQRLDVSRAVPEYEELKAQGMARRFPFELDPFQQHAIVCLENGSSVFVAAHTSAGKTVVADYAIALCKAHRTRVIYTSPIKALSNQKYRDFRCAFGDVGLVTGDMQLHTDAFCLVMTTEILRSMLYNGSEVIRELEWAIFDEVHYINDAERGHVWEEVLIMLPAHVKIVMLSATVPNCLEFADWVGRIKNRIIYVIATRKRPVPLEHHLYTGQDGRTRDNLFKIIDKEGDFLSTGYRLAEESKAKKEKDLAKKAQNAVNRGGRGDARGGGPSNRGNRGGHGSGGFQGRPPIAGKRPDNSKNIYINLLEHLRSKQLLPVVTFIFSRYRCDLTAQLLRSVDLTTQREKWKIKKFFARCIDKLKGSDKELPQVRSMQELCERGFAIHHAGILPIVKEVVELLFQQGLVRVLFATETFAMGVNMPARTVVFDNLEKFDSKGTNSPEGQMRPLNPTEYVQMAGRAGRRGLDATGTVIILQKGIQCTSQAELKSIILGKPIDLISKFRITYQMMLNLLRVERIKIEDMLQRSYIERASLSLVVTRKDRIQQMTEQIEAMPPLSCERCATSLPTMIDALQDYIRKKDKCWRDYRQVPLLQKLMTPGQILLISYPEAELVGRLGIIVNFYAAANSYPGDFRVNVLVPTGAADERQWEEKLKDYQALTSKEEMRWRREQLLVRHFVTWGVDRLDALRCTTVQQERYRLLTDLPLSAVMAICKSKLRQFNVDEVLKDAQGRWGPHQEAPISQPVRQYIEELQSFAENWSNLSNDQEASDAQIYVLGKDLVSNDLGLFKQLKELIVQRQQLVCDMNIKNQHNDFEPIPFSCLLCSALKEHLSLYLARLRLEEERDHLIASTSSTNLVMSEEYTNRLKVLRYLKYVDIENMVTLKGKVACEISNQELLISELILENKFQDREPPEIAAMLSAITSQFKARKKGGGSSTVDFLRDQKLQNNDQGSGDEANNSEGSGKPPKRQPIKRMPPQLEKELILEVKNTAVRIDSAQCKFKIGQSIADELNFELIEPVYHWAAGMEFADIMTLVDGGAEGLIVRCIQRLDELCRDIRKAARVVGDTLLFDKMERTGAAIRRDIVFAASLYTTEDDTIRTPKVEEDEEEGEVEDPADPEVEQLDGAPLEPSPESRQETQEKNSSKIK